MRERFSFELSENLIINGRPWWSWRTLSPPHTIASSSLVRALLAFDVEHENSQEAEIYIFLKTILSFYEKLLLLYYSIRWDVAIDALLVASWICCYSSKFFTKESALPSSAIWKWNGTSVDADGEKKLHTSKEWSLRERKGLFFNVNFRMLENLSGEFQSS